MSEDTTLRIRRRAVSPAEEFTLRPGSAEPLSNDIAALILCCKGTAEIGTKHVVITRKELGGALRFYHPESIILNDLSSRARRYHYALNRIDPSTVHLFTTEGRYVESLPLFQMPDALDTKALARATADQKHHIKRMHKRMEDLHGTSTKAELTRLESLSSEMFRVVQTFPAPDSQPIRPSAPPREPSTASRAISAARNFDLAHSDREALRSDISDRLEERAFSLATSVPSVPSAPSALSAPSAPSAPFDPYDL